MNHVTYETAVRLKEAGFPQPAPEAGQFWYCPYGGLYFLQDIEQGFCRTRKVGTNHGWMTNLSFWVFAPTATDILKALGFPFYLIYDETAAQWFLNNPDSEVEIWKAGSPAEAAAQAFLNLKAKQ